MRAYVHRLSQRTSIDAALPSVLEAIQRHQAPAGGPTITRIEARVSRELTVTECLDALGRCPSERRVLWLSRDNDLWLAGVGEAWAVGGMSWTLTEGLDELSEALAEFPECVRMFGGVCFQGQLRSKGPWRDFGAWRFALPAVEIGRDDEGVWCAVNLYDGGCGGTSAVAGTAALCETLMQTRGAVDPCAQLEVLAVEDEPQLVHWRAAMSEVLSEVASGALEKIVMARRRRFSLRRRPDPVQLWGALAEEQPTSFRFLLQPSEEAAFFGASPERLFALRDGVVLSEALAGTRSRGADTEEDEAFGADLLRSVKDGREHEAVVQMLVQTLTPLCSELQKSPQPSLMKLSRIQHLQTSFRARLAPGVRISKLLTSLHPTPAVCGAPRAQAQAWLAEHEHFQRGLYAAPVGWIGGQRTADFTVAIRSALLHGAQLDLFSGAGIVEGSRADEEWAEIDQKISGMTDAFGIRGELPK